MSWHQYVIQHHSDTDEMEIIDGTGTTIKKKPTPAYGVDYKRFLADTILEEYQTNGVSESLLRMVYVSLAETWSVK